jgi:hypothetical protein
MFRILVVKIYQDGKICPDQSYQAKLLGSAKYLDDLAQAGWRLVTVSVVTLGDNYTSCYAYLEKEDFHEPTF